MGRPKKYSTEEEKKAAKREYDKRYREAHPEKVLESVKRWREANPEKEKERRKRYRNTPKGRAVYLISAYQRNDKNANRGECTLTADWIVENIFTKPCHYCAKEGWDVVGCDRIDNSKPHTPDNVVPCCFDCNRKISGGRPKQKR